MIMCGGRGRRLGKCTEEVPKPLVKLHDQTILALKIRDYLKRGFREWSRDCVCPPGIPVCQCRGRPLGRELTRGPERPTPEEVERNPRSRSARLRAWERAA